MSLAAFAAAAILATAAAQGDSSSEAPAQPRPPTAKEAPTQVEGVTVKRTCRTVETTGARVRRRVCSDDAGAANATSGLGTINKSQQGNINMAPRR